MTFRVVTFLFVLAGCGAPELSYLREDAEASDDAFVTTWSQVADLADTGLYSDVASQTLAANVKPYAPQFALWSDGLDKRRYVALPAGAFINNEDPDFWRFPVGTRLWKEFAAVDAVTGERTRIETRMIAKVALGQWTFATYKWNREQTEATLSNPNGEMVESAPGGEHDLPSVTDCQYCHLSGGDPVLGFSELQLAQRTPKKSAAVTLDKLVADRALSVPLASNPEIVAANALEREVLGYLHTNCGSCHNPRGAAVEAGVSINYFYSLRTITRREDLPILHDIGRRAETGGITMPEWIAPEYKLIDLERPDASMLLFRIAKADTPDRMPRIGSKVRDSVFIEKLKAWLSTLSER